MVMHYLSMKVNMKPSTSRDWRATRCDLIKPGEADGLYEMDTDSELEISEAEDLVQ